MRDAALIKVGAATGSEMKEKKARAALANGSSIAFTLADDRSAGFRRARVLLC